MKELVIEASNLSLGGISSGEVVECQFAELLAGGLEVGDTILELLQKVWLRQIEYVKLNGTNIRFKLSTIQRLIDEGTVPALPNR